MEKRLEELQEKYREAVFKESSIREAAFLPMTLDLGGVSVKQFTPYMYTLLDFVRSPFLSGEGEIDGCKVADFLWVVSPEFREDNPEAKAEFVKNKCLNVDYEKVIVDINAYLLDAFIDIPAAFNEDPSKPKRNTNVVPFYAWVVSYIDALCSEYGWNDDKVLHMPFARIFQYMKAIEARKWAAAGKEPQLFNNLSDRAVKEIRKYHKEQEAKLKV